MTEAMSKMEQENYKKAQSLKVLEIDKHSCDIKILELTESLRSEKLAFDLKVQSIQREKELDISKIGEELNYLK